MILHRPLGIVAAEVLAVPGECAWAPGLVRDGLHESGKDELAKGLPMPPPDGA
jgi:hypothetical protein